MLSWIFDWDPSYVGVQSLSPGPPGKSGASLYHTHSVAGKSHPAYTLEVTVAIRKTRMGEVCTELWALCRP